MASRVFIVDNERFQVSDAEDHPGHFDVVWLSGPNVGYGFSFTRSDSDWPDDHQLRASIKRFLAQVDPATGYLD